MAMQTVQVPEAQVIKRMMKECQMSEERLKAALEKLITDGDIRRIPGGMLEFKVNFEECSCGGNCPCNKGGCDSNKG